jgi:hypothetical protein
MKRTKALNTTIAKRRQELLVLGGASILFAFAAIYFLTKVALGLPLAMGGTSSVVGTLDAKALSGTHGAGPPAYSAGANEWRVRYHYSVEKKTVTGDALVPGARTLKAANARWLNDVEPGSNVEICMSNIFPSVSALKCGGDANDEFRTLLGIACLVSITSVMAGLRFFKILKGE